MAKTINLTVQVDDSQFQKFMRDYTAFSNQVKTLQVNFKAVTNTISQAQKQTIDWQKSLQGVNNFITGIVPGVKKITEHFSKWAALIGGIGMMLGTGSILGIDRLANTLVQRRRQMLMLGGDWGGIQARQLGAQGTISDTMGVMQRIQYGKMGDVLTRAGLQAAGVNLKDVLDPNKSSADIFEDVIRKMPETFKQAEPGQELQFIIGRHLDKIMPVEEWMKFIKPGGGVDINEQQRVLRNIEEQKKHPGLTPEEGRSWADLYTAAKAFVTDIQTKLGSSLSGIAGSLTEVSKGFSNLLDALLDSPAVKRALAQVKEWLDSFAEYLKGDEAKKKLQEWTEEMEKIPWAKLGEVIGTFIENLGTVIRALLALKGLTMGAAVGGAVGGPLGAAVGGVVGAGVGWFSPELLQGAFTGKLPWPGAPGQADRQELQQEQTPGQQKFNNYMDYFLNGLGGWFGFGKQQQAPTFPVNPMDPNATVPPAATGQPQQQQQGAVVGPSNFAFNNSPVNNMIASGGSRTSLAMAGGGGGSPTSSVNVASMAGSVRSFAPRTTGTGGDFTSSTQLALNMANGGRQRGRSGPLDVDNWQMNRTAQLRIDNVAGASVFATGVGLA
jgi:hypothetical protein